MRGKPILLLAALSFALPAGPAIAQSYPDKPIRLIVPFRPADQPTSWPGWSRSICRRVSDR
jgi:hypothetical protein